MAALCLAGCGNPIGAAIPGETPEYQSWYTGIKITSGAFGNITGGVEKKKLKIDFRGFPLSQKHDSWVELFVNKQLVQRYWLDSPSGKPLVLHHEMDVPQGMLSVQVWYTGLNKADSLTGETPHGLNIVVQYGGPSGMSITQSR